MKNRLEEFMKEENNNEQTKQGTIQKKPETTTFQ